VRRTHVYVDGFNVYYGVAKGTAYKWLDYEALAAALVRGHRIDSVKYFTARLDDRNDDPQISQRQDTYLRALNTRHRIEIHFGHFRTRAKAVPLAKKEPDGTRTIVTALVTEEKGSDVSLGAHLVWDACRGHMETALVLSNDSDLQTPVTMAMELGIEVIIVNPHRHHGQAEHLIGSDTRNLRVSHLQASQLPDPVTDEAGRAIHKPSSWA